MNKIKTANSKRHNFNKRFKKYLVTKSSRTLEAVFRTKRFDAGFFWMEFWPLVSDMFLSRYKFLKRKDLDMILQLHANQPFTRDDVLNCIISSPMFYSDVSFNKKNSVGERGMKSFIKFGLNNNIFYVHKKNGRYNKIQYYMCRKMESEIRSMYRYVLCLSKIRINDDAVVCDEIRDNIVHKQKILKQNKYCEIFNSDTETQIKTTNSQFGIKLREARAASDT